MTCPSPRRAAAALALVCLALLPTAGHATHRPKKAGPAIPALDRIIAGSLYGLLDRLATLLPGSTASKRGSGIDPDGATSENGGGLDPFGAMNESDRGSGIDPNG